LDKIFWTLLEAAKESRRTVASLLLEMIRLRFSIGRLGFSEYFDFRLYLNDLPFNDKQAFGGWRAQNVLEEILIDDYSRFLSLDKISMYMLLRAYGLPAPEIRATYRSRRPPAIPYLGSLSELTTFLSDRNNLPVYLKPSLGSYGHGNALIIDCDGNTLVLGDRRRIPLQDFCQSLDDGHGLGWLLQEPLAPHPNIAELCGNKISGIRIHSFLSSSGPVLTKAIWKINVGREDSDNFRHGASGNLLAAVDMETGEVTRVVSGIGLKQKENVSHPVTGMRLMGFSLPYWEQLKSVVKDAQLAFPGFLCPGWDVAICADGPKILEVNFMGDIDLSQHAHRRGFLDREFLELMRGRRLDHLLSFRAGRRRMKTLRNSSQGYRQSHWRW
jgi:hypothetical protein